MRSVFDLLRVVVFLCVALGPLCACSTARKTREPRSPDGLPHFAAVDSRLFRGGQPDETGLDTLKRMGVKTVVKLNTSGMEWEAREVEKRGMTFRPVPINLARQVFPFPGPLVTQIRDMTAALRLPGKTYVHCSHGWDRTGLAVGLYQVHVKHMDRKEVFRGMIDHGFHPFPLLGLLAAWRTYQWSLGP